MHRFQLPNFRVAVPTSSLLFNGAQIPVELAKAGLDISFLRDAHDLVYKFGMPSDHNPGMRLMCLNGMTIAVSEDAGSHFMQFQRDAGNGEPMFISVATEERNCSEAIIWDTELLPKEVNDWSTMVDQIGRTCYLVHPITGLRYDTQGKGMRGIKVDPNWYFSEAGTYIVPVLYGHKDCHARHFQNPQLLTTFQTDDGQLALCRRGDRDLAILRAKAFVAARTKLDIATFHGQDEALCELRMRADDGFEKLRITQPSTVNLPGTLPEELPQKGGFFVPVEPIFDIFMVIR